MQGGGHAAIQRMDGRGTRCHSEDGWAWDALPFRGWRGVGRAAIQRMEGSKGGGAGAGHIWGACRAHVGTWNTDQQHGERQVVWTTARQLC
eukprot:356016-Chlamydomonas_euryale.AAC.1